MLENSTVCSSHCDCAPRFYYLMIKLSLSTGFYYCAAQLRYIWESEELRRAMEPVDLIRRVCFRALCE
jgi:hypothetical protein